MFAEDIIENLAYGYGLAQQAGRMERRKNRVLWRLAAAGLTPSTTLVVETSGTRERYDDDGDFYEEVNYHNHKQKTVDEIVDEIIERAFGYEDDPDFCGDGEDWENLVDLTSLTRVWRAYDEYGWTVLHTVAAWEQHQKDERRKNLESTASEFAAKCGHKVGTREFVLAAKEEIASLRDRQEQWDSGEARMERYATCAAAGCRDAFWSDNDYVSGKFAGEFDRLGEVLDYMEENFPLLMLHIEQEGHDEGHDED